MRLLWRAPQAWLILWFSACVGVAFTEPQGFQLDRTLQGASGLSPWGFDAFGRDLLPIVLRASLLSSLFALGAALLSVLIASFWGTLIVSLPQRLRFLSNRALDFLLAFPSLLFALAWAAVRGPGWNTLVAALLLGTLPHMTRLVVTRSEELLAQEFVLAARSLGATPLRVMRAHLVPSVLSICWVSFPNLFAQALLAEATLSFLGVGAPVGRDTWGSLLIQAKDYLIEAPHILLATGVPLILTVLSLQSLVEDDASLRRGA
jgi:peptide/nickel transport system permease protein